MGTNKAEEIAKEIYRDNPTDEKGADYKYNTDIHAPKKRKAFLKGYMYRQSEIDELTKEKSLFIEKYTKSCDEVQKLEKKIDELSEVLKLSEANYVGKNAELTKEVEMLRKEREWISVEDRLPIEKEEVLVKVGTQSMGGMKYRISIGHCNEQGRFNVGFDWSRVTHWQPLPPINH